MVNPLPRTGKTVEFNAKIVAQARAVAPAFEFPAFAQAAVREKIDRERRLWGKLNERLSKGDPEC